jgi:hypothetical protein
MNELPDIVGMRRANEWLPDVPMCQSENWPAAYGESAVTSKSDIRRRCLNGSFVRISEMKEAAN